MPIKRVELARVYSSTTGTGSPITLGSAVPGYLTFAQAGVVNGDTVNYSIRDGVNSEVGSGPYSSTGPTLTRNVYKSTNADAPLNLSGNQEVFIGPRAADFGTGANQALLLDDTGKIPAVDGTQITGVVKTAGSTMTGNLSMTWASPTIVFAKSAGGTAAIYAYSGGQTRWTLNLGDGTPETGSNVGSNFSIGRFADNGSGIGTALSILRNTGATTIGGDVTIEKSNPGLLLNATGTNDIGYILFNNGTSARWLMKMGGEVESGGSTGSDFSIARYNNSGVQMDIPFLINRQYGSVALGAATNGTIHDASAAVNMRHNDGGITTRGFSILNVNSSLANAIIFMNGGAAIVGQINTDASSTAFVTSSDVRLKTDVTPFTRGREILDQIMVKDFTWKESNERDTGVIAQDVERVFPRAVSKGQGEPGDEGFMAYGIDNSKLVPVLIQALQEAFREIDALKTQIGK
jgi:hypothetical protein